MIIDTETMNVKYHRISYDVEKVLSKLRNLGLEERYYQWLRRILLEARI